VHILAQEHLFLLVLRSQHLLDKLELLVVLFDFGVGGSTLLQLLKPLQHQMALRFLTLLSRQKLLKECLHLVLLVVNYLVDIILLGEALLLLIKSVDNGRLLRIKI
jgi:hypothetical protein